MSIYQQENYTVLEKAVSESHSDEHDEVFKRIESTFTKAKINRLRVKLRNYRNDGIDNMSPVQRMMETHSSKLLGEFMRAMRMPRPGARWEAHHIISGDHPEAEESRTVLASPLHKMRIDDPANGCWMPKTKADARPTMYPNAIGHNRIHREKYYRWVFNRISILSDTGLLKAFLNTVRQQLLDGNISDEYILQEEIDDKEYYSWLKKVK